MVRKAIALLLCFVLACSLCGCHREPALTRYSVTFWDCFDTYITLIGYAPSQQAFDRVSEKAHEAFERLHALCDRYTEHPGVNGIWALNHAGGQPLSVEKDLMELIGFCIDQYSVTQEEVNVAMGAVLALWSDARALGTSLPDAYALCAAALHCDINCVKIDHEAGTVQLLDPEMQLDLGAIAKGWAVERVAQLICDDMPSYLINAGGNLRVGDAPPDREGWSAGVTDPVAALEGSNQVRLAIAPISQLAVVTSGGYQRYYEVDGRRYHHLIDPETCFPADHHLQVTVLTADSGQADALSTALFLMPYEQGRALVESLKDVEVIWVQNDGSLKMTAGAQALATGA